MALHFFRQRDIDRMDVNDIPEEFVNYIESLDEDARGALVSSRPDLAEALGVTLPGENVSAAETLENSASDGSEASEAEPEEEEKVELQPAEETGEPVPVKAEPINHSIYEGRDIHTALSDNMKPLEALAIPDHSKKCAVHRIPFERIQIRYTKGSIYSIVLRVCPKCQRAFMEESSMNYIDGILKERGIAHIFYDLETSNRYLRSQMKPHELGAEEKLYVPAAWIEENPTCPIHGTSLIEILCTRSYKDRKVTFTGCLCEQCNKILIRKAHALELEDVCARSGVPAVETEPMVQKELQRMSAVRQKKKPDFIIEDGKKSPYNYGYTAEWYELTEADTIVVSDTIYCSLDGHDSEEVLALIYITEKRGGRKAALFVSGYCARCQKFYMDLDDYKLVYQLGRPEVKIIRDFEDTDYQITSGEVFNLEREHLNGLEGRIDASISEITAGSDYVSPYATGDYDDGGLRYAKSVSSTRYGNRLKELRSYIPTPYLYRVDIAADEETERYYIGARDVILNGHRYVISANSDFGHELIHYQTTKIKKQGREYSIRLSRQFDIGHAQLYGYMNLRTDEDVIFKSGITDPFLVRVLNMRKKQHDLTDIFVTIQENQNEIVNAPFRRNIIVQGCAGSGKTMVLLHRLSSLAYRQKSFDFGRHAMILTPNDRFTNHIKSLAEGLQINHIERVSVEQYYIDMLVQYDPAFKPDAGVVTEMAVPQDYVNYIYSDLFRDQMNQAFDKVMEARNALGELLYSACDAMGAKRPDLNFDDNPGVMQKMRFGLETLNGMVSKQEQAVTDAQEKSERVLARIRFLEKKVPEAKRSADGIVNEAVIRVNAKIRAYLTEEQQEMETLENTLREYTAQREKAQRRIIPFGRQNRLANIDAQIEETAKKLKSKRDRLDKERALFEASLKEKTEDEIISWMRDVSKYIKDVRDEIRLCNTAKENYTNFSKELRGKDAELREAEEELKKAKAAVYSEDVIRAVRYLSGQIEKYTLLNTYRTVFDEATANYKKEHNIKNIGGKCHRYDLYAQLLFAMKYFGDVHGEIRLMCVDEGQDLSVNEYQLIYDLNQKNLIFNVFGDTNQLMKPGRGVSDWTQLRHVFNATEYVLNENYRNTNQITGFCNSSFEMNVLQTGADGPVVQEIPRREMEERLSALNITSERVAVLLPRRIRKKQYLDMNKIAEPVRGVIGDTIGQGYVALMYVDEVKGIEFDKVFVVGNDMGKNEKYIAYTRALTELILVVDDASAQWGSNTGDMD